MTRDLSVPDDAAPGDSEPVKVRTRRNAFRQCDVERAIRAAQATNAGAVIVRLDGSLLIEPRPIDGKAMDGRRTAGTGDYVL